MTFTQAQLREHLAAAGVPSAFWQLPDLTYESVSGEHVRDSWAAWIDSLRLNAPQLLISREIGGGKTIHVPRWIEEAGDCDDAALCCLAHAVTGNWRGAVAGGPRVGRARGLVYYTAEPRPENLNRLGRHACLWFVDHERRYRSFEPGDGTLGEFTLGERMTSQFGLAA